MAQENNNESGKPLIFKDKRTKAKIDRHLSDINDEISEADIASVKTDVTPNTPVTEDEADKEASEHLKSLENKEKDKFEDGNNTNDVDSSWNILDKD
ncbi:MAG: hypothetical protein ABIT07_07010 [Ferruginibacter sp.]